MVEGEGLYRVSSRENFDADYDVGGSCDADSGGYTGTVELEEADDLYRNPECQYAFQSPAGAAGVYYGAAVRTLWGNAVRV